MVSFPIIRRASQILKKVTAKDLYYPVQKAPLYWIDEVPTLLWTIQRLKKEKAIGIDTETNSLYAYDEKVCLIQLSSWDEDFIIDPFSFSNNKDLSLLNQLTNNPKIIKVLHGADYDICGLKRDFQLEFVNIFDSYLASRYLLFERIGLGDLVSLFFNIKLNKELTKYNWSLRPIPEEQVNYAREDVRYIIPIMEILTKKLKERNIYSETKIDFERLTKREWTKKDFDSDGYMKIKGAKELSPEELKYLKEIYIFREKKAKEYNIPAFKVLSGRLMFQLIKMALNEKVDRNKIYSLRGLPGYQRHRIVSGIERAINKANDCEPIYNNPLVKTRKQQDLKATTNFKSAYFSRRRAKELLKQWRIEKAKNTVHPNAVLPNVALEEILQKAPANLQELVEVPFFGKSRSRKFGAEILKVLNDCRL